MISAEKALSVMNQLEQARKRKGLCLKKDRQIAAGVIDGDKLVFATNTPPCPELICSSCPREDTPPGEDSYNCPALHAEVKCIVTAINHRYDMMNSSIVVTHFPCIHCSMLIIYAGIKKVYYRYEYYEDEKKNTVIDFLSKAGVGIYKI